MGLVTIPVNHQVETGFSIGIRGNRRNLLKVVMFGPSSAQKPQLRLGFWGLRLTRSSSQAIVKTH